MTGQRRFTLRLVLFLCMSGALLVWALHALGAFSFVPLLTVETLFEDATGLLPGSVVTLSGVQIGQVSSIDLTEDFTAVITFTVERRLPLTRNLEARLVSRSLLGEKAIALTPRSGDARPLADGDRIPSSGRDPDLLWLASHAGDSLASLEEAMQGLRELTGTLADLRGELGTAELRKDLEAVGDLARRGTAFLDTHDTDVGEALRATRAGASSLTEVSNQAKATLQRLDGTLKELDAQAAATELRALTTELRETAGLLRQSLGEEGSLGGGLRQATQGAGEFFAEATSLAARLKELADKAGTSLGKVEQVAENLRRLDLRELRKILQDEGVRVILLD